MSFILFFFLFLFVSLLHVHACPPSPAFRSAADWRREFGHLPQFSDAALMRWRRRLALASTPVATLPPLLGAWCVPARLGDVCFEPRTVLRSRERGCCGRREFVRETHECCVGGIDHAEQRALVVERGACFACPWAREAFELAEWGGRAHAACCGKQAFNNRTHTCIDDANGVVVESIDSLRDIDDDDKESWRPTPVPSCYYREAWRRTTSLAGLVDNRAELTADNDVVVAHLWKD